jgi:hypothetical protein
VQLGGNGSSFLFRVGVPHALAVLDTRQRDEPRAVSALAHRALCTKGLLSNLIRSKSTTVFGQTMRAGAELSLHAE